VRYHTRFLWWLLLPALVVLPGCETRVGLAGGSGAPTAPGGTQSALVGVWSLILVNQDASGALVSSSETRWRFASDGTATRTSIATSFVSGLQDVVTTSGTWSATSTTITINLPGGPLVLPWSIERSAQGDVLVLGTLRFLRRS
jgi:hypothetical protein